MIVVDTGVLVALLDADDEYHQRCREWCADAEGPLIVPTPVMVETQSAHRALRARPVTVLRW